MSTLTITGTVTDASGNVGSKTVTCTINDDAFVLGETKPVASNTGLNVENPTLTIINGDLTIDNAWVAANGTTFTNLWIKGHLIFTANVAVYGKNSRISGRTFSTPGSPPRTAIVYARSTSTPTNARLHLENCKIEAVQPDVNIVCTSGEKMGLLKRCDLSGGSDGGNWWGTNASLRMEGCYVHDYTFWTNDTKHANDGFWPNASHNDGGQTNGCVDLWAFGNNFDMRADPNYGDYAELISTSSPAGGFPGGAWGSALMLSCSTGYCTNAQIKKNWFGYGRNPVMMPYQSNGLFADGGCSWEVSENRFYALPIGYGSGRASRHLIAWGATLGPLPESVWGNVFTNDSTIPSNLRGTTVPAPVLQGTAGSVTAQYISRVTVTP
jgi:hypothetical protein